MTLGWGVAAIPVNLFLAGMGYYWQQQQMAAMAGQMPAPVPMEFMRAVQVAGLVFGLLLSMALPVFLLIWLRRTPIQEETAGWS